VQNPVEGVKVKKAIAIELAEQCGSFVLALRLFGLLYISIVGFDFLISK
jgi:hypothetical protein